MVCWARVMFATAEGSLEGFGSVCVRAGASVAERSDWELEVIATLDSAVGLEMLPGTYEKESRSCPKIRVGPG